MTVSPAQPSARDLPDEEIVARVLRGERELFAALVRRYNQRLFRLVRSIVRPDDEAEDALQDAYLHAYARLGTFEGRASVSTWLARIAMRSAGARRERTLRERDARVRAAALADPPAAAAGDERLVTAELRAAVERAIDALDEPYRVVAMLRLVEELPTAEVAAALEVSDEVVRVRLHRARAELRRRLAPRLEAELPRAFAFAGARCDRITAAVLRGIAAAAPPGPGGRGAEPAPLRPAPSE